MQAIILAGGKGTRLKPFTNNFPKPLVPVGDLPILEIVIRQLSHYGFKDVVLAVNHLAELIMAFFGDGKKFGVNITYSIEDVPLGTAGPLSIIPNLDEQFLVMNGDLLTTVDYLHFFRFHQQQNCSTSIATFRKQIKVDLGVLKIENGEFQDYIEKPTYEFDVSMGLYIMNKSVLQHIPQNQRFDLPDLVLSLRDSGERVACYRGDYFWLDIGRVDDYEQANVLFSERKDDFLPNA